MLTEERTQLYGYGSYIKYCMLFMNFLFLIFGIALMAVGPSVHSYYSDYKLFLDDKYFSIPDLVIATGCIMFIISLIGCCGVYYEHYYMLITFTAFMVLALILQLATGISGYVLRDSASEIIKNKMNETMGTYTKQNHFITWDHVQTTFSCCGTEKPDEWLHKLANQTKDNKPKGEVADGTTEVTSAPTTLTTSTSASTTSPASTSEPSTSPSSTSALTTSPPSTSAPSTSAPSTLAKQLPVSCCPPQLGAIGQFTCTLDEKHIYYKDGCQAKLAAAIEFRAAQIGGFGLAIFFLQIVGIGFAVYLLKALK